MNLLYLALAALLCFIGDWLQTRYIAGHSEVYRELNPLLGAHPSRGTVDAYFTVVILFTAIVVMALPAAWQDPTLLFLIVVEGFMVIRNASLGIKFK